jgi:transposase-like protein
LSQGEPDETPDVLPEQRERPVRIVIDHRSEHTSMCAAIVSIAAKIGCTAQTLSHWVKQAERDAGKRMVLTTDERERIKALEREFKELRQADEILRKASAYFAQAKLAGVRGHDQLVYAHRRRGEPICKELPIAPSTNYEHAARCRDPERQPTSVTLSSSGIGHVCDDNF